MSSCRFKNRTKLRWQVDGDRNTRQDSTILRRVDAEVKVVQERYHLVVAESQHVIVPVKVKISTFLPRTKVEEVIFKVVQFNRLISFLRCCVFSLRDRESLERKM